MMRERAGFEAVEIWKRATGWECEQKTGDVDGAVVKEADGLKEG